MCGKWEGWGGCGTPGTIVWEGGEAQMRFLGAAVRGEHCVSFQRLRMCVWPLDSGAMPLVPTRLSKMGVGAKRHREEACAEVWLA